MCVLVWITRQQPSRTYGFLRPCRYVGSICNVPNTTDGDINATNTLLLYIHSSIKGTLGRFVRPQVHEYKVIQSQNYQQKTLKDYKEAANNDYKHQKGFAS